jgi:predicted nucleic acid-binding protein
MVNYCLDTGILIAFFKNDYSIINKIEHIKNDNQISTTVINLCELYRGAFNSLNREKELSFIDALVSRISILDLDHISSKLFGELYVKLQKQGKIVDDFDLIISSIAKKHNAIIVTRNKKHFVNSGIRVEEW